MKIAIFSDLHDNIPNLDIFLSQIKQYQVKSLIFCGDLSNPETLHYLCQNFTDSIYLVGGNADSFDEYDTRKIKNLIYNKYKLEFKLDNQKILVAHKPTDLKKILAEGNQGFDFAFYGHTHKPWLLRQDGLIMANPGTLREPAGKSSFALLDSKTGNLELKILTD